MEGNGRKDRVIEEIKEVIKEIFPPEIVCDIIKKVLPMYPNCAAAVFPQN